MPDTLTDADLQKLLALGVLRLEPISVLTIEDIEEVLHTAIYALDGQLREDLAQIILWRTDDARLLLIVEINDQLRLTSASVDVAETFIHPEPDATRADTVRHILDLILAGRHALISALEAYSAPF
ncbi:MULTISPECIES: hypothetical protein [Nocardia]|uniref:hypothetical protein n=1 Tax=Nocardia TaxID=1817 RepID=UPI0002E3D7CA|nr:MULTISPECIES: hypothetical protein [Nocardia]